MKFSKSIIFITLSTFVIIFSPVYCQSEVDDDMENYMSECNAPAELYDPEALAEIMSDPDKFMQLVASINNPATQ
jgi:hypothetical protein